MAANKKHNYRVDADDKKTVDAAFKQLRKYDAEIDGIKSDVKDTWAGLKDQGLNVKALKETYSAMKKRERDPEKFDTHAQDRDLWFAAMGLI